MSKQKKKARQKGTDKQMLAAVEARLPVQDAARQSQATGTTMHVEDPNEHMPNSAASTGATEPAVNDPTPASEPAMPAAAPTAVPAEKAVLSLGQRLREARRDRGWTQEEVGGRLHLPVQIIQRIEAEQYEKIGYGIYLRGYLNSYARLVDVPRVLIDSVVHERAQTPPLVTSGTISHSRYLYQRYSVSALYLILTGIIIVPAVLLAMRASLHPHVAQLTALDRPALAAPADSAPGAQARGHRDSATAAAPVGSTAPAHAGPAETPLVASLAPFSALSRKDDGGHARAASPAPAEAAPTTAQEPMAGTHTLKLTLSEPSWVEVTSKSGDKLEYGLLPAGSVRTYQSAQPLEVRLGNCSGAQVEVDGAARDLGPYRHANVAHFRLFSGQQLISPTDS